MVLQCFVNWLVSYIFKLFVPTITFAKKFPEAIEPTRRDSDSIGYDLYTPIEIIIEPRQRVVVDTGIIFQFPSYLGMFIWDKSSMAYKHNLSVCAGVIDPDYRGCVGVILENCHSNYTVTLPAGSAIAQAVFHLTVRPHVRSVMETDMTETVRGKRGFGEEDASWTQTTEFERKQNL